VQNEQTEVAYSTFRLFGVAFARRIRISPKPHILPAASLIGAAGFSLAGWFSSKNFSAECEALHRKPGEAAL
jgi:hypothetical protein